MGRVDHSLAGEQAGANMERVKEALNRLDLVYCEMEPGDALFFHCNLLHRSDRNQSERPRWSLICCYNSARNDPYKESQHSRYTPLRKVEDGLIKQEGLKLFSGDSNDAAWLEARGDATTQVLKTEAEEP